MCSMLWICMFITLNKARLVILMLRAGFTVPFSVADDAFPSEVNK